MKKVFFLLSLSIFSYSLYAKNPAKNYLREGTEKFNTLIRSYKIQNEKLFKDHADLKMFVESLERIDDFDSLSGFIRLIDKYDARLRGVPNNSRIEKEIEQILGKYNEFISNAQIDELTQYSAKRALLKLLKDKYSKVFSGLFYLIDQPIQISEDLKNEFYTLASRNMNCSSTSSLLACLKNTSKNFEKELRAIETEFNRSVEGVRSFNELAKHRYEEYKNVKTEQIKKEAQKAFTQYSEVPNRYKNDFYKEVLKRKKQFNKAVSTVTNFPKELKKNFNEELVRGSLKLKEFNEKYNDGFNQLKNFDINNELNRLRDNAQKNLISSALGAVDKGLGKQAAAIMDSYSKMSDLIDTLPQVLSDSSGLSALSSASLVPHVGIAIAAVNILQSGQKQNRALLRKVLEEINQLKKMVSELHQSMMEQFRHQNKVLDEILLSLNKGFSLILDKLERNEELNLSILERIGALEVQGQLQFFQLSESLENTYSILIDEKIIGCNKKSLARNTPAQNEACLDELHQVAKYRLDHLIGKGGTVWELNQSNVDQTHLSMNFQRIIREITGDSKRSASSLADWFAINSYYYDLVDYLNASNEKSSEELYCTVKKFNELNAVMSDNFAVFKTENDEVVNYVIDNLKRMESSLKHPEFYSELSNIVKSRVAREASNKGISQDLRSAYQYRNVKEFDWLKKKLSVFEGVYDDLSGLVSIRDCKDPKETLKVHIDNFKFKKDHVIGLVNGDLRGASLCYRLKEKPRLVKIKQFDAQGYGFSLYNNLVFEIHLKRGSNTYSVLSLEKRGDLHLNYHAIYGWEDQRSGRRVNFNNIIGNYKNEVCSLKNISNCSLTQTNHQPGFREYDLKFDFSDHDFPSTKKVLEMSMMSHYNVYKNPKPVSHDIWKAGDIHHKHLQQLKNSLSSNLFLAGRVYESSFVNYMPQIHPELSSLNLKKELSKQISTVLSELNANFLTNKNVPERIRGGLDNYLRSYANVISTLKYIVMFQENDFPEIAQVTNSFLGNYSVPKFEELQFDMRRDKLILKTSFSKIIKKTRRVLERVNTERRFNPFDELSKGLTGLVQSSQVRCVDDSITDIFL